MSNVFSLDSLREEVEKQFAPLQLEIGSKTVTLSNLMRLPKLRRDKVLALLKELENEEKADIDMEALSVDVLAEVSDNPTLLRRGLKDELALAMKILNLWMLSTQSGEAESSSD
ncbi:MAG: hypothetical protein CL725_11025 [Chloroflexi bacterium]|nr:hypothetical protein [Chloroflexota bacterium]